jgi:uncharacterized protein with FMN-binding domain
MTKNQTHQFSNPSQMIKKLFLTSFVVFTFIAYVIHQRFTNPDSALNPAAAPASFAGQINNGNQGSITYKDGVYTGPQVDAYYGIVEVQVNVQNGKIANVQFLQYPQDRRTSARINSIAVPDLQQEALQAQSANVNIVSGATLTSEGFMMSLNAALNSAKN